MCKWWTWVGITIHFFLLISISGSRLLLGNKGVFIATNMSKEGGLKKVMHWLLEKYINLPLICVGSYNSFFFKTKTLDVRYNGIQTQQCGLLAEEMFFFFSLSLLTFFFCASHANFFLSLSPKVFSLYFEYICQL